MKTPDNELCNENTDAPIIVPPNTGERVGVLNGFISSSIEDVWSVGAGAGIGYGGSSTKQIEISDALGNSKKVSIENAHSPLELQVKLQRGFNGYLLGGELSMRSSKEKTNTIDSFSIKHIEVDTLRFDALSTLSTSITLSKQFNLKVGLGAGLTLYEHNSTTIDGNFGKKTLNLETSSKILGSIDLGVIYKLSKELSLSGNARIKMVKPIQVENNKFKHQLDDYQSEINSHYMTETYIEPTFNLNINYQFF